MATNLIGPYTGLVSGAALIVDYILTIAISVASGADAVFSLLPVAAQSLKLGTELGLVLLLLNLNLRGMRESIKVPLPTAFGTDPIEELTKLAEKIYHEFPHSIFFTSKLIFESDNWYIRQLHSEAALTMLRRCICETCRR